jgi:hypothetical protein
MSPLGSVGGGVSQRVGKSQSVISRAKRFEKRRCDEETFRFTRQIQFAIIFNFATE